MRYAFKLILSGLALAATLPFEAMAADDSSQNDIAGQDEFAGFNTALSDNELQTYRGGFTSTPTMMFSNMSAMLDGNTANNAISGSNSISDNAFSNNSGLTSVIQNSGNNVIIQSSFQVNVNFLQQ